MNVITNDPVLGEYSGKIQIGTGAYNMVSSDAVVNIPLMDTMALRLGGSSYQQTGVMHPDGRNNEDFASVRGKLLFQPNEDLKMVLMGVFTNNIGDNTSDALPQRTKIANFASPAFGGFNPCGGNPVLNPYDPWHSPPLYYGAYSCTVPAQLPVNPAPVTGVCQTVARTSVQRYDINMHIEYDFGWATSTSDITDGWWAQSEGKTGAIPFQGRIPPQINWNAPSPSIIVESRLNSASDSVLKWIAGVYYQDTQDNGHQWRRNQGLTGTAAPFGTDNRGYVHAVTKAVFGQATYPIVPDTRITLGGRYSISDAFGPSDSINIKTKAVVSAPSNTPFKWNQHAYKAVLEHDLSANSMIYASYANGFKPGIGAINRSCVGVTSGHVYAPGDGSGAVAPLPNGGCAATTTALIAGGPTALEALTNVTTNYAVTPDAMTEYEIGSKNRFFDNKVEVNIAAYYSKFDSLAGTIQRGLSDNTAQSVASPLTGTKAWGTELETSWLLTANDRIDFGVAYTPSQSGVSPARYPLCYNWGAAAHLVVEVDINTTNRAACAAKNLAANPATVNWVRYRAGVDANDPLFHSPRWTGSVNYQHVFDLQSGATVTARVSVNFKSGFQSASGYFYDGYQPAFHKTDLALSYDTADGKWSMAAWVRNVANIATVASADASGRGTEVLAPSLENPRMWGVNLTARFN